MNGAAKMVHAVAESIDAALAHADELGLYDDMSAFPAARIAAAEELIDRLNGFGWMLVPRKLERRVICPDCGHVSDPIP